MYLSVDLRWIFYSVCVVLLVLFEHDVSNSCKWLVVCAGVRSHDEIHQSGEPGRVSSPHCSADGHRHVLHRLVLCVSFTIHTWAFSDPKAACKDVWIFASLTPILRYEVTSTKYTRDLYKELLISLVASLFMGFGVLFLLLWVGIYVWKWVSSLFTLSGCVITLCVLGGNYNICISQFRLCSQFWVYISPFGVERYKLTSLRRIARIVR